MKRIAAICFSLALLVTPALAAWDWANPTYAVFATQANLDTISGLTGSTPTAIAVDTDGSLLVVDDPGGSPGNVIDVAATGGATGTILITEADLTNATPQATDSDLDLSRMAVASDGTIYLCEYDSDDDVLKIARSPLAASSVAVVPGNVDMALDEANSRLLVYVEGNFTGGTGTDGIKVVALPSGAVSDAATDAQILAVTAASGVGSTGCALLPGAKLAFYDEGNFGGSDSILTLENPGATPTIASLYSTANVFSVSPPGISNVNATAQGDLICWNEFSGNTTDGSQARLTIIPAGATQASNLIEITEAQILAGLAPSAPAAMEPDSKGTIALKVVPGTPNKLVVFLANTFSPPGDNGIYTITFNELTAEVPDWALFN